MDTETTAVLRSDIISLRNDVNEMRQDIGSLEIKVDSLEAWRIRYLAQEDQVISKLFNKIDELMLGLSNMRSDLSHLHGERDAERRTSIMIVSLLSATCGGLLASLFHG